VTLGGGCVETALVSEDDELRAGEAGTGADEPGGAEVAASRDVSERPPNDTDKFLPLLNIDPRVLERMRLQMREAAEAIRPFLDVYQRVAAHAAEFIRPAIESYQRMVQQIDLTGFSRAGEVLSEALKNVDWSGVAEAVRRYREQMPPNWQGIRKWYEFADIALEDGIPVMWVPGEEVLAALADEETREARVAVLLDRREEVLTDCRTVLDEITHPAVVDRVALARQCADAIDAGFSAAAQALAVACTESLLTEHVGNGRSYAQLAEDAEVGFADITPGDLRAVFTLMRVARFYTPWWPSSGPSPVSLSRHATVHHARADHLTPENALIAVMLLVSLIRHLEDSLRRPELSAGQ
jgi:hypothetical protein